MSPSSFTPRGIVAWFALAACVLLSGCLLTPGKFTAALDLRKDGRFSYSYTGEIFMFGLSDLAQLGAKADEANAKFEPSPCFGESEFSDEPVGDAAQAAAEAAKAAADAAGAGSESEAQAEVNTAERKCTAKELAGQKADWEAERKANAERKAKDAEMMRALLGGIDPTSPKAAEEMAERLRRQAGWKSVTYAGNGLFKVDFAISGRLDHDFAFPTVERFPTANAFVTLSRRADGSIRMDSPGFGPANGAGGMGNFAQLAAMGAASDAKKDGDAAEDGTPQLPQVEGTFVLTTDGSILANNTDEGPRADTTGQRLEWTVNARTATAPMALVKIGN